MMNKAETMYYRRMKKVDKWLLVLALVVPICALWMTISDMAKAPADSPLAFRGLFALLFCTIAFGPASLFIYVFTVLALLPVRLIISLFVKAQCERETGLEVA